MNINILVKEIKEKAPGMEVLISTVQKGNAIFTGISIGNDEAKPTVYVEHYEALFNGFNYGEIAKEIIKTCKEAEKPKIDKNTITNWHIMKTKLKLCIAPRGTNKEYVTYPFLDLELYVRAMVDMGNGQGTFKVQEHLLDTWGITKETLFYTALNCTKPFYEAKSFSELMFGMEEDNPSMIIIKTNDGLFGASAMFCKDILHSVAKRMDSDLYIIPSSIHEIICLSIKITEPEIVTEMIKDVNENGLKLEEILSDHVYMYHKDTMEITY